MGYQVNGSAAKYWRQSGSSALSYRMKSGIRKQQEGTTLIFGFSSVQNVQTSYRWTVAQLQISGSRRKHIVREQVAISHYRALFRPFLRLLIDHPTPVPKPAFRRHISTHQYQHAYHNATVSPCCQ